MTGPDLLLSAAAPAAALALAMLGALLCERAGLRHFGLEGILAAAGLATALAMAGALGIWGGVAAALVVGAALGLVQAGLAVGLGASPMAAGFGVTLLAGAMVRLWPAADGPFAAVSDNATAGLVATALLVTAVLWWGLARTPMGAALRSAGDAPEAVVASGLSLRRLRLAALVAGSMLMGLGGAGLVIGAGGFDMAATAGRGWLCLALVVVAARHPALVPPVALAFAALLALLPEGPAAAWPWLAAILALAVATPLSQPPRALQQDRLRDDP